MSIRVWVILLLSASGYVKTMEAKHARATSCESAVDSLQAENTGEYVSRFLSAFPSIAEAFGFPADSLNATLKNTTGVPADFPNAAASPREAMNEFCRNVNKTAKALSMVVERCARAPGECPSRDVSRLIPFTPDVLWAVAELCSSRKAVDYLDILGRCHTKIVRHPSFISPRQTEHQVTANEENPKIACFISYGRKFACRYVQLTMPLLNQPAGDNIMKACGQETLSLALEFLQDAMRALHCSEFGDFVRTFDWVNVNYHADGSAH